MSRLFASEDTDQLTIPCSDVAELVGDIDNRRSLGTSWQRAVDTSCLFRRAVLGRLEKLESGQLTVVDRSGAYEFGQVSFGKGVGPRLGEAPGGPSRQSGSDPFSKVGSRGLVATINVNDRCFYRDVVLGGGLGAAESYIRGHWDSPDLTAAMRVLTQNTKVLAGVERGAARLFRPLRSAANWLRRNTRAGSKRNISAHYDLSNDFFALMLDPTMTYSSGVFPTRESTLEEASIEKYDRICRKLQLTPEDHLLEIGTGWGGFAEHAVRNYGCRVTTTTISDEQHAYAERRFRASGIDHRVTLLKDDYRDLYGAYDKLVSIEMIEAVGEKFLPGYFAKCSELLKPHGMMCLQAITIPDHRYDQYRKSVDFIQRYIFPGGFLPSMGAMASCVGSQTDFRFLHTEDFGPHYAATLAHWRHNFWQEIDAVKSLGFDERFIRTWQYYLCYCEAGFREREIGVSQLLLTKPACRREPVLSTV